MEQIWKNLNFAGNDELNLVVVSYLAITGLYFMGAFLFYILDNISFMKKYKIRHSKIPENDFYSSGKVFGCLCNLCGNFFLVALPLIWLSMPMFSKLGFVSKLPLPHLSTVLVQIFFYSLIEDFSHYWLHRFLHLPWFYKNIHYLHHAHSSPCALVASYAHPIEILVLGTATFIGPMIIPPHYFTFIFWVAIRQLDALWHHSGYDFNLLFFGQVKFHDDHHRHFKYNYASRYTFWDDLFCTRYIENAK